MAKLINIHRYAFFKQQTMTRQVKSTRRKQNPIRSIGLTILQSMVDKNINNRQSLIDHSLTLLERVYKEEYDIELCTRACLYLAFKCVGIHPSTSIEVEELAQLILTSRSRTG
jgi:hypothetical protein